MFHDIPEWETVLDSELTDIIPVNDNVFHLMIGKNSHIYCCMPWENIYVWANCVADRHLPFSDSPGGRYATVNYCLSGCCEVCLPGDTYIYIENTDMRVN